MGVVDDYLSNGHAAIDAAKGVGDGDRRSRVGDPFAIHHEEVFVDSRVHFQGFGPTPIAQRDHGYTERYSGNTLKAMQTLSLEQ